MAPLSSSKMAEATMNSEHPDTQAANPADKPVHTLSIPRWAAIAAALVVLLPVLAMSSMMLMMGWFGPPMHGGMAASDLGIFRVVGVIPLLLVLGVMYGPYRLSRADMK